MKAWLKGGLIGAGVGITIDTILFFLGGSFLGEAIFNIFIVFGFPWSFIIGFILFIFFPSGGDAPLLFAAVLGGIIGIIINGFIIGALVQRKLKKEELTKTKEQVKAVKTIYLLIILILFYSIFFALLSFNSLNSTTYNFVSPMSSYKGAISINEERVYIATTLLFKIFIISYILSVAGAVSLFDLKERSRKMVLFISALFVVLGCLSLIFCVITYTLRISKFVLFDFWIYNILNIILYSFVNWYFRKKDVSLTFVQNKINRGKNEL